jgi:hypothetical protein
MSSWGKADAYTSAPLWALLQVNKAPTLVNMGPIDSAAVVKLFENAEADDFITNVTIGLFNYADGEVPAGAGHAGWNFKVQGSGGRNGRTQYETLVALTDAA